MKLLLLAYECHPRWGSEPHVGWTAAQALARRHDVWVLTSKFYFDGIEDCRRQGLADTPVHFVWTGRSHEPQFHNGWISKASAVLGGARWRRDSLPAMRALHQQVGFDVIQHVTTASWRYPSHGWRLGVPFIWGPIGGGENVPPALWSSLGWKARAYESLRAAHNAAMVRAPSVRQTARKAGCILVSNQETEGLVRRLLGSSDTGRVRRRPNVFFDGAHLGRFMALSEGRRFDGPLHLFAGGYLEQRKGFALALAALGQLREQGIPFHYTIAGVGPAEQEIGQQAHALGLDAAVSVLPLLHGEAYADALRAAHVYFLPSLREQSGITLMEAMLTGCVPVVADGGGPGEMVGQDAGFKIPMHTPTSLVSGLAAALRHLHEHRDVLRDMSVHAQDRIVRDYDEDKYLQDLEGAYTLAGAGS